MNELNQWRASLQPGDRVRVEKQESTGTLVGFGQMAGKDVESVDDSDRPVPYQLTELGERALASPTASRS